MALGLQGELASPPRVRPGPSPRSLASVARMLPAAPCGSSEGDIVIPRNPRALRPRSGRGGMPQFFELGEHGKRDCIMQRAGCPRDVIELSSFLSARLRVSNPCGLRWLGLENAKTPDFQPRPRELNPHVGPRENGTAIRREP